LGGGAYTPDGEIAIEIHDIHPSLLHFAAEEEETLVYSRKTGIMCPRFQAIPFSGVEECLKNSGRKDWQEVKRVAEIDSWIHIERGFLLRKGLGDIVTAWLISMNFGSNLRVWI
jgi:hypothetical protein